MHIRSQFPPVNTTKPTLVKRSEVAVAGSETNADAEKHEFYVQSKADKKRRGKDRRKRNVKPLLDSRSGKDRRYDAEKPSINIEV